MCWKKREYLIGEFIFKFISIKIYCADIMRNGSTIFFVLTFTWLLKATVVAASVDDEWASKETFITLMMPLRKVIEFSDFIKLVTILFIWLHQKVLLTRWHTESILNHLIQRISSRWWYPQWHILTYFYFILREIPLQLQHNNNSIFL